MARAGGAGSPQGALGVTPLAGGRSPRPRGHPQPLPPPSPEQEAPAPPCRKAWVMASLAGMHRLCSKHLYASCILRFLCPLPMVGRWRA